MTVNRIIRTMYVSVANVASIFEIIFLMDLNGKILYRKNMEQNSIHTKIVEHDDGQTQNAMHNAQPTASTCF